LPSTSRNLRVGKKLYCGGNALGRKIALLLRKPKLEADGYSDFPNNAREAGRVNEFYQKGCQEKSSASTGGEMFSRDPAHWN
jgi:hypothetical protein